MNVIRHITKDGERWDLLAWRYYGSATDYERIIAANPGVPRSPVLCGGIELLIPVVEKSEVIATEELPPWER